MNVIMLLKHKDSLKYIYEDNTLRQGLEKMRAHSYTAIPVITRDGKYVGTVSEGDFLWHIIDKKTSGDIEEQEEFRIRDILRPGRYGRASCTGNESELYPRNR